LSELFDSVKPFAESIPYTDVDCLGVYLEVANGKTETSPAIIIRTDRVVILAGTKI